MSSELQRQVASIRKQHLSVVPLHQGRPSLFLTAAEAAAVDVSTIHEAAQTGLATLQQYDARFEPYHETLLHPSSVDLQRESKTAAENKALDVQIHALLKLLSLYALEASAHLVLEYLIRRYRIHEMNTHELIQSMLVAHDTKIFARIVQLCKLEDSPWVFLKGVKDSGVPLPRAALVQRALKDAQLLEILSQYVQSSLELVVQRPNSAAVAISSHSIAGANKILSFYTAVVLEMAEDRPFDDARVRHVYLFLVEGLKNKYTRHGGAGVHDNSNEVDILDQWRRACCMVLVQLSIRTPFGKPLIKVMSGALAEALRRHSATAGNNAQPTAATVEIVSTMTILAQQEKFRIGGKVLSALVGAEGEAFAALLNVLAAIKGSYNVAPFTALLAAAVVSELCQPEKAEEGASLAPAVLAKALAQLLSSDLPDGRIVRATLVALLNSVKTQDALPTAVVAGVKASLQCIAQRFAAEFEHTVAEQLSASVDTPAHTALTAFLADVFAATDLQHHRVATTSSATGQAQMGGGLLLSLSSAIPSVRAQALSVFATAVSPTAAATADILGLVHAAAQCLLDPIIEVASAAWTVPVLQRVAAHLSGEEVFEVFSTALAFWSAAFRAAAKDSAAHKLVAAIFSALDNDAVLKKVLEATTGTAWMLQHAGSVALGDSGDAELALIAARVLKNSATHSSAMVAFSTLTLKTGATQEAVTKAVTSVALGAKFLQHDGNAALLGTVAASAYATLLTYTGYLPSAAVLLQVLIGALEALRQSKADVSTLLRAVAPLLLNAMHSVRDENGNSAHSRATEAILSATESFAKLVPHFDTAVAVEGSLAAIVVTLSAPIEVDSLGARLLVAVLTAPSAAVARRLGAVLQALQPATVWAPLLRLVLAAQRSTALVVPAAARLSALQALAAYLAGVTAIAPSQGKAASSKLSGTDSQLAVLLVAVALQLCSEASAEYRQVGLLLASRLPASAAQVTLTAAAAGASAPATGDLAQAVKTVCVVLAERSTIIAVEQFAATTALAAGVFESADANKSNSTASALGWLATQFGWTAPQLAVPIYSAARGAQLSQVWSSVESLISSVQGETDSAVALVDALIATVSLGFPGAAAEVQARVVSAIAAAVQSHPHGKAGVVLKEQAVGLITGGLFASSSAETRNALYQALLQEQIQRPGQQAVLNALAAVQVDLSASSNLLIEALDAFGAQYHQQLTGVKSIPTRADADDASEEVLSGLSVPLQRILSVLEAVVAAFTGAKAESDGSLLGYLSARILDFLAQLNDTRLRSVMLVDYCKALAMDAVYTALTTAGAHALTAGPAGSKKSASSSRKSIAKDANNGNEASGYALTRVDGDIRLLLSSITNTKTSTVQTASLRLLKVLLALNPASVVPSMQALSELLATSSTHMQAGKEGLVEQILRTFVSFLPEAGDSTGSDAGAMPQYLLQSLCQHFHVMPHHRRGALLKMALSAMKAPATLAVAVNLLLVHSYVAHEIELGANGSAARTAGDNQTSGDVMILLSKSAHRRAQRDLKASVPEELFSLATELMLMRTPNTQVNVIIALLSGAHRLLDVALGNTAEASSGASAESVLDISASVQYCDTLLRASPVTATAAAQNNHRGHAATIAILHLELVLEILENRTFHQLLVSVVDANGNNAGAVLQDYFMSFADGVLQLLAMTGAVEQGLGAGRVKELLSLCIDGTQLRLSPKALGKHVSGWCYEALRTLQKLMDGPSFVAIIQELINHEHLEVRQKALVILGERLEGMSGGKLKDDSEIDLYLDLNSHLLEVVQAFVPTLKATAAGSDAPADFHQQSGLAQSALMCIDVLARFLGKRLDWSDIITETLNDIVELNATLVSFTNPTVPATTEVPQSAKKAKKNASAGAGAVPQSPALQTEYCKLLGSSMLCAATLCTVLGAKSLPKLPTIMGQNLSTLEGTGAQVVAGPALVSATDAGAEEAHALWRTRVLLVRSTIAAVGIVVAQLSKFSHPYIPRILTAALALEGLSEEHHERVTLREDVDRCLSTVATKIPARLSIPLFLQSAPTLLGAGHSSAARFADLLAEVWQQLDRSTVVAHLAELSNLATLLLDYRRVFGDQSTAAGEVDAAATDAVVELCLKLTESELKSFLTKLAEWRDVKFKSKTNADGSVDASQEWRKYARAVSYFSLADALMGKLLSLFIPIMGVLWGSAISLLEAFHTTAVKFIASAKKSDSSSSAGKGGKRKGESVSEEDGADASHSSQSALLKEFELLAQYILSSVRECCAQDSNGFVDEVRYEKMMQAVVALLPLQRVFDTEDAYLSYSEDYVGACLSALAQAVGKDLLWKPLNHKVLMLTRDSKKAVRVAAVKVLHRLFSEVGEDYLILLPECIPFLSELMEDANRDVVAATAEAIRFIEELSGEKLDAYMQ